MVRKSSKFISSASPSDACRRFLLRAELPVTGSQDPPATCSSLPCPSAKLYDWFFPPQTLLKCL